MVIMEAYESHQQLSDALHNDIPISIPANYLPMTRETRQYHPHHLILLTVSTSVYLESFFSKTVQEWNSLPQFIIDLDHDTFSINISNYYNAPVPV